MEFKPYPYQATMIDYIEVHEVSALFLQMGLGKTVITLSAIHNLIFNSFEVKKVLIIAPIRVARDTWPDECEKWEHLKLLRYSTVIGSVKERTQALKEKADIYFINRENIDWLVNKSNIPFDFSTLR